ncbi:MAG: hypothetical protein R3320_12440 [Nitriliruptorales bacterium]|nr:hypothetical protein [Nitriliruptorales bacterium]
MERGEADSPREPRRDEAVQAALPLDLDAPIPFELTARARRAVAPSSLPALEVVSDGATSIADVPAEDPHDTRPARARALRRAGMSLSGIAAELDAPPDAVAAWVVAVDPVTSAQRRLRSVDGGRIARPRAVKAAAEAEHARQRYEAARRDARAEVEDSLDGTDPRLAGLGVVVGAAQVDEHAILVRTTERPVAVATSRWLQQHLLDDPGRLRVILRVAPQAPGDMVRHAWAELLGVPAERVSIARWRNAPDVDSVEATLRVADAAAAGRFAGWRDALLDSLADPRD